MALFNKSCRDNVESIFRNGDKIDELFNRITSLENLVYSVRELLKQTGSASTALNANMMRIADQLTQVLENQSGFASRFEPSAAVPADDAPKPGEDQQATLPALEEQAPDQKPRRKMNTRYDPSLEYLNSVQLVDKFRGKEMEIFGRKKISTQEINRMLCEYGLAKSYESAGGYVATVLGLKTGVLFNNNNSHLTFKNSDETEKMLSMLFNNPLKSKAYISGLKEGSA